LREFNTQFLKISLIIILFLFPSVCFSIEVKRSFIAWGTNLDFIVQSNESTEEIDNIINSVQKIPLSMNEILNRNDNNSELFLLNSLEPGIKMKISENLFFLIKQSIYFHEITNGYFDITTASLMPDADKGNRKCMGIDNLIIENLNQSIIKKKKCTLIDLDGIAEGYVIKLMLEEFERLGVTDVLINFGGNISTLSKNNEWDISIKNPDFSYTINSVFKEFNNLSISTSSQYSKLLKYNNKTYSHITNPFEFGLKKKENISISIISDNPIYADAMSTALQAMPIELALEYLEKNSNIRALILKKMPDSDRTETLINSL
tara:strand:- start:3942 stop:4898 length:957 start_codon:yes stop_codon:yes gene_type:complete